MKNLLKKFEENCPEVVFDRKDRQRGADRQVVINSYEAAPIGGCTRMRKKQVLQCRYKSVMPPLKSDYGTGNDLSADEIYEIISITEDNGLWHPQEEVINGHYQARENQRDYQIRQARYGSSKAPEDLIYTSNIERKHKIADKITGYEVSESLRRFYHIFGGNRIIVQEMANVAASERYYLCAIRR